MSASLPLLYRGSVKDLRGPLEAQGVRAVVFDYSDAYSVFDWGRMPDLIPGKGRALARLASYWLSELERPAAWQDLSRTSTALALRRGARQGGVFNDLGERLQAEGLRTHLLPSLPNMPDNQLLVRAVEVRKPAVSSVLGREVYDYSVLHSVAPPRLIPLEVIFRFSMPEGSSLSGRVRANPDYLTSIGFVGASAVLGSRWDFPVLEMFTKLENSDRVLGLQEASLISGISCARLEEMLLMTAWVAGFLRERAERIGVELADGKFEWALDEKGGLMLVDAIGPDEVRLLKDGVQLSKEFLRLHYRSSPWYEAVRASKERALQTGTSDWKRQVTVTPAPLPPALREITSQLYMGLTAEFLGEAAPVPLERLVEKIRAYDGRA